MSGFTFMFTPGVFLFLFLLFRFALIYLPAVIIDRRCNSFTYYYFVLMPPSLNAVRA